MKKLIYNLAGLSKVSDIIDTDIDSNSFFEQSRINYNIEPEYINFPISIQPKTVFVSTHHSGGVDFLAVYPKLVASIKPFKVIINKKLLSLKFLKDISITVNPVSSNIKNDMARSEIKEFLDQNGSLLIYPAGKVAKLVNGKPCDYEWRRGSFEIFKEHADFIVPIYVKAHNSKIFYLLREKFPKFSSIILLYFLDRRPKQDIKVIFGEALKTSDYASSKELMNITRKKVYEIGDQYEL